MKRLLLLAVSLSLLAVSASGKSTLGPRGRNTVGRKGGQSVSQMKQTQHSAKPAAAPQVAGQAPASDQKQPADNKPKPRAH